MNPESLIEKSFRLTDEQKKALRRLNIETVTDLLYHFPTRYSDMSNLSNIDSAESGSVVTLYGKLSKLELKKGFTSRIPMATATLEDFSGNTIKVVWMNQAYLAKMFHDGDIVKLTGKISDGKYGKGLMNPEIERTPDMPIDVHDSLFASSEKKFFGYPIYPETRGITSKWFYHAIQKVFQQKIHEQLPDPIPSELLKKYKLPGLRTALVWIHGPEKQDHAETARKRFAFEEIFLIQVGRQKERADYEQLFSYTLKVSREDIQDFMSRFPFKPTTSQLDAIRSILKDFQGDKPMSRLIEGDVGSGKTFVAATVAYATIKNRPQGQDFGNLQVAYMAPTEVLATQLFENFVEYFKHTGISIGLITGSGCRKFPSKTAQLRALRSSEGAKRWTEISRTQLLKWVKNGEIPILIGTHALIQKSVAFEDLGLVIIDEQHRFGTNQRMKLAKKEGHAPHYLSMTATPIPRTLALTLYGDLDLTIIDQMPSGRKPVITEIITPTKRELAYDAIKKELALGRQAYIICPRIDEPDPEMEFAMQAKSVVSEAKRLERDVFQGYRIDIMHSKMTPIKKAEVMKKFSDHQIDILVSTSVVEVGVNVPNATNIIIEGADRFGLAQLHQLRGRVLRGNHQAYCYLFAEAKSQKTADRLKAFVKAKNGFELAELDLLQRGSGDLAGLKQWGISDIGMDAIKNIKMVEFARNEAIELIKKDPLLEHHTLLKSIIDAKNFEIHFE